MGKAIKAKRLLLERLEKNWSELLKSEKVDRLSHMPEEWKSSIVPVLSKTGQALNKQLCKLATNIEIEMHIEIEILSKSWQVYGGQHRRLALKNKLNDLIAMEVDPFFESRNQM